ncbi:MAG TPA: CAAX prenyl protease-related protein [Chthoniobacterales bacterium]
MQPDRIAGPADQRRLFAHVAPILLFALLFGATRLPRPSGAPLWRAMPEFWVYPLQTLACAAVLLFFRRQYEFHPLRRAFFTIVVAFFVFAVWIAPQQFLGFPDRVVGFNLDALASSPPLYWTILSLRFLRLVVVVPLLEEIFWRGFLLRYLIAEQFDAVPFGTFSWFSFALVTLAFALSHARPDWPAALIAGVLYNVVAYRTKSLTSCALAHALTNLALGCWILATRQWGFW